MKMNFFLLAALFSSSAYSQINQSKTLDSLVITANKFPQKQQETGKVLTVITRQQIELAGGKSISELLNTQVGISIGGANNNPGSNQTVYTRGAASANTLILLDGIPLYDASGISSEFDLNSFSLFQIERIEILKGAQSTLYGSDAVAAVINIITKKASGKVLNIEANASAGSYGTFKGDLGISGSTKKGITYAAEYSKTSSDGFSSAYDSLKTKTYDSDRFDQAALSLRIGLPITKSLSARIYGKYNKNKAEIDAGAFMDDRDNKYESDNTNAGVQFKYQLKKAFISLHYNYNNYNRQYLNDSTHQGGFNIFEKSDYAANSHYAELYGNWSLHKRWNLVAGIDYRYNSSSQSYYSLSAYGPYETKALNKDSIHTGQTGVYASAIYQHAGLSISVGGRWNHHTVYGDNTTYSFNPSYQFKRFKIFGSIASAFRVPSLYQLYSEYGNTSLKPERSENYELGLSYEKMNFSARAVYFYRNIKDVFVFYTDPITYAGKYINDDRQQDYGFELELSANIKNNIYIATNYTYVEGKIFTKDFTGKDTSYHNLYRRPRHTFNFDLGYRISKTFYTSIHIKTVNDLYEPQYASAPKVLPNYYSIDFYAEYRFMKNIKAFVNLRNITDQDYFDQDGYSTRGFNWMAGLHWGF